MSAHDDDRLLARFRDRMHALDAQVPEPPPLPPSLGQSRVRRTTRAKWQPGGLGTSVVTLAALALFAVVVGSLLRTPAPPAASPSPTGTASGVIATAAPTVEATRPPAASPSPTPTLDGSAVVQFANPDGPNPADYPPDAYPFIETANALPTIGQVWMDDNQRDYHIGLTGDIEGAIEAIRDGVPRGITIYFHIVEYTQAELCALSDAMFDDREELFGRGIALTSGGCGTANDRIEIGLSPFTPEVLGYMRARYPGPIDYEKGGWTVLGYYQPPEPGQVRLVSVRGSDGLRLSTCGRRPFPAEAISRPAIDINTPGEEYRALRDSLTIYAELYGDLTNLGWLLVEQDDYGATFLADRSDTWLEAPVLAGRDGWVSGTIDYCSPRPLTAKDEGSASLYLDPAYPVPGSETTELHVLVEERGCGSSPASRLLPPTVQYRDDTVTVTVRVRGVGGPATCQGNPRLPVVIELPEPLGDRALRGISAPPDY